MPKPRPKPATMEGSFLGGYQTPAQLLSSDQGLRTIVYSLLPNIQFFTKTPKYDLRISLGVSGATAVMRLFYALVATQVFEQLYFLPLSSKRHYKRLAAIVFPIQRFNI